MFTFLLALFIPVLPCDTTPCDHHQVEPPPAVLTRDEARTIVARHFPAHAVNDALRVMGCESLYQPAAVGDGGRSLGLFQIQPRWWATLLPLHRQTEPWFLHPEHNVMLAHRIWRSHRWFYWSCKP